MVLQYLTQQHGLVVLFYVDMRILIDKALKHFYML